MSAASSESTPLYLRSAYPLWEPQLEETSADSGERLRLTAYLERGKVDEARKVARVGPGLLSDRVLSYAGYLTVERRYNSNLFFWFFPSQVGTALAAARRGAYFRTRTKYVHCKTDDKARYEGVHG